MGVKIFAAIILFAILFSLKMKTNADEVITRVDEYSMDFKILEIQSCSGRKYVSCSVKLESTDTEKKNYFISVSANLVPLILKYIKAQESFKLNVVKITKEKEAQVCIRRLIAKEGEFKELETIYTEDTYQYNIGSISPRCTNPFSRISQ